MAMLPLSKVRGGNPFGGGAGAAGFDGFGDIFEEMFGSAFGGRRGGGGRSQPGRGSDLQYNMSISLDEAFEGKTTQIKVPSAESCSTCFGLWREAGDQPDDLWNLRGPWTCADPERHFSPWSAPVRPVRGRGRSSATRAGPCGGAGKVAKDKQLSVNIPAGVEDGTRIRLVWRR